MKKSWIIVPIFLLLFAQGALAEEGARPPITERFQALFEETGDLAIAYHLARIHSLAGNEAADDWLALLEQRDWQMGIDEVDFISSDTPTERTELISRLQAQLQLLPSNKNAHTTLLDPQLLPESIAYDARTRALFAGSLLGPRIVTQTQPFESPQVEEREFLIPDSDITGSIYGIKHDVANGWLWVIQNGDENLVGGSVLTVLDRDGHLVKHYQFSSVKAEELNDLCLSKDAVYVTDSRGHRIFRGPRGGDTLSLFYENDDLQYPNGIACNDQDAFIYVADYRGISRLSSTGPVIHRRLVAPDGFSLGGIDGLYLWQRNLIGIQNALGAPKVVKVAFIDDGLDASDIQIVDAFRPDYRIPTTGFIEGECLYYIANSSLDALGADGTLNDRARPPTRAKIIAQNLATPGARCKLT